QGQVTTTNKSSKTKITRSTISSPMSSGPPSPVKMHMKSKSLTLRGSPKKFKPNLTVLQRACFQPLETKDIGSLRRQNEMGDPLQFCNQHCGRAEGEVSFVL
ncbi:8046_t:CDS:2, partial [Funneliformis caledonium]